MIERKKCKFWKLVDKVSGEMYDVFEGAPCGWSLGLGATHTLLHDVGALPCRWVKGVSVYRDGKQIGRAHV